MQLSKALSATAAAAVFVQLLQVAGTEICPLCVAAAVLTMQLLPLFPCARL
jgi:hypothetical protein